MSTTKLVEKELGAVLHICITFSSQHPQILKSYAVMQATVPDTAPDTSKMVFVDLFRCENEGRNDDFRRLQCKNEPGIVLKSQIASE